MSGFLKIFNKDKYIYKSIDELPLYCWLKIIETGNLEHLLKPGGRLNKAKLELLWSQIFDEFIDTFGISEKHKEDLELQRDILCLSIDRLITGDLTTETFIEIKQYQLDVLRERTSKKELDNTKAYVEKYMGFKLDERTTSVKDYYSYIVLMAREANKQPANE